MKKLAKLLWVGLFLMGSVAASAADFSLNPARDFGAIRRIDPTDYDGLAVVRETGAGLSSGTSEAFRNALEVFSKAYVQTNYVTTSAANASDALLLRLDGSRYMTANLRFSGNYGIYPVSSDGDDHHFLEFCGGGSDSVSRGAVATFYGNEYPSLGGSAYFFIGDSPTARMYFFTGDGVPRIAVVPGGHVLVNSTVDDGANQLQVTGSTRIRGALTTSYPGNDAASAKVEYDGAVGPVFSGTFPNIRMQNSDSHWLGLAGAEPRYDGYKLMHVGNDGSGSGFDADLLEGQHGTYYETTRLGADTTDGTLDWNDATNARPGSGITLLMGNALNGPGPDTYFHTFCLEYSSKNGSGNMTQFAIPYYETGSVGMYYRTRYEGAWTSWFKIWSATNDGSGSGLDADTLDTKHASDFVATSTYTAADVLTKIKTVDGSGSGLDADTVPNATPASASADGTAGSIRYDANYIYICTAANTWKRAAISTW